MLRFLLDHNFPSSPIEISTIDRSFEWENLRDFDPDLISGTPDWMIILAAAASERFDALVTRDTSQLDNPEELVALMDSGLSLITWRSPIEDPIVEWGQLLAYMPQVVARLGEAPGGVIRLPTPRLTGDAVQKPRAILGRIATDQGRAFPELRDGARGFMRAELRERGRDDLDRRLHTD